MLSRILHELADVHLVGITYCLVRLSCPALRSQLTTVKNFSRCRVFLLLDVSCDVPGPPCRYRTTGLSTSSDL